MTLDKSKGNKPFSTLRYQDVIGFGAISDVKAMCDATTEPVVALTLKMSTQFTWSKNISGIYHRGDIPTCIDTPF